MASKFTSVMNRIKVEASTGRQVDAYTHSGSFVGIPFPTNKLPISVLTLAIQGMEGHVEVDA